MKKYLVLIVLCVLVGQFNGLALESNSLNNVDENTVPKTLDNGTHMIFIEECTATWCPNCPMCAEALYNLYNSGEYSFSFVALIHDMNPNAQQRLDEYTMGLYRGYAFPTTYIDGGILNMVGRGSTVSQTENLYRGILSEASSRIPNKPIALQTSVEWLGDATIRVTVEVTNEGNGLYFGKVRSYITEIESRWNNYDGDPYHFGFLDFAINDIVFLLPGKTQVITAEWDGSQDHNGISFSDIKEDNIKVTSTISHWKPSVQTGYESSSFTQKYLAFPVDQTHSAIIE